MSSPTVSERSTAAWLARCLKARGVDRVFALCGGHIMPLWMRLDAEGIRIIDVRDERAAVYMAHAHAELTGQVGVALVTAGPGVTNAMTGIANAHVARASVLVLSGTPPRAQENRGALQDMVHTDFVRPLTRYARTVREPELALQELDEAFARAQGIGGEPGPVYLDFPVDTLRAEPSAAMQLQEWFAPRRKPSLQPDAQAVAQAVEVLWSARRPLVISGRGAREAGGSGGALVRLLERLGALYLDTGESRGLVPEAHPSVVAAMRASVMAEADVVITLGRKLDFQLAYGSPAVFGDARFVRIADTGAELRDNRRGAAEVLGSVAASLEAILAAAGERVPASDREWAQQARAQHEQRSNKLLTSMQQAPAGSDGRMHPNRLLAALRQALRHWKEGRFDVLLDPGSDTASEAERIGSQGLRVLLLASCEHQVDAPEAPGRVTPVLVPSATLPRGAQGAPLARRRRRRPGVRRACAQDDKATSQVRPSARNRRDQSSARARHR